MSFPGVVADSLLLRFVLTTLRQQQPDPGSRPRQESRSDFRTQRRNARVSTGLDMNQMCFRARSYVFLPAARYEHAGQWMVFGLSSSVRI